MFHYKQDPAKKGNAILAFAFHFDDQDVCFFFVCVRVCGLLLHSSRSHAHTPTCTYSF